MSSSSFIRKTEEGTVLQVRVQPRSKKNEIVGTQDHELRIKVAAPPVDSAANIELIKFLARTIGCSKSSVFITRGRTSRHKTLLIQGVSAEGIVDKLSV